RRRCRAIWARYPSAALPRRSNDVPLHSSVSWSHLSDILYLKSDELRGITRGAPARLRRHTRTAVLQSMMAEFARHADYAIACLNALFLMFPSFIPFPTALMREYATNPLAFVAY